MDFGFHEIAMLFRVLYMLYNRCTVLVNWVPRQRRFFIFTVNINIT